MWYTYLLVGISVLALVVVIIIESVVAKRKKKTVKIKKGVRYSMDPSEKDKDGNVVATVAKKDLVLRKNEIYFVKKDSEFLPGKYTILTSIEDGHQISIRINNENRKMEHGANIILAAGDEITALNTNVILR